jgi:hypothetical protein
VFRLLRGRKGGAEMLQLFVDPVAKSSEKALPTGVTSGCPKEQL